MPIAVARNSSHREIAHPGPQKRPDALMLHAPEVAPADVIVQDPHASPDLPPGVAGEVRNPVTALAKVAEADNNLLPGTDVLEAFFYLADPRSECRQIAEEALRTFGSVGAVLSARVLDLITNLGIRRDVAYRLKAIHVGICSVAKEATCERLRIGSFTQLIDYMGLSLKHENVEVLRLLYLDRDNGLIADEEASRGTVDHVPLYPREVVKRALELGASAVIMVHNHPSGDPTPSEADVSFSQWVERALSILNITLHDSLIIGRNASTSLRRLGRL